jgi:hypothetical protein
LILIKNGEIESLFAIGGIIFWADISGEYVHRFIEWLRSKINKKNKKHIR